MLTKHQEFWKQQSSLYLARRVRLEPQDIQSLVENKCYIIPGIRGRSAARLRLVPIVTTSASPFRIRVKKNRTAKNANLLEYRTSRSLQKASEPRCPIAFTSSWKGEVYSSPNSRKRLLWSIDLCCLFSVLREDKIGTPQAKSIFTSLTLAIRTLRRSSNPSIYALW